MWQRAFGALAVEVTVEILRWTLGSSNGILSDRSSNGILSDRPVALGLGDNAPIGALSVEATDGILSDLKNVGLLTRRNGALDQGRCDNAPSAL